MPLVCPTKYAWTSTLLSPPTLQYQKNFTVFCDRIEKSKPNVRKTSAHFGFCCTKCAATCNLMKKSKSKVQKQTRTFSASEPVRETGVFSLNRATHLSERSYRPLRKKKRDCFLVQTRKRWTSGKRANARGCTSSPSSALRISFDSYRRRLKCSTRSTNLGVTSCSSPLTSR